MTAVSIRRSDAQPCAVDKRYTVAQEAQGRQPVFRVKTACLWAMSGALSSAQTSANQSALQTPHTSSVTAQNFLSSSS